VRKRKWDSYRSGEELFGLPVTQYPELERTEEDITMLDKLYRWGWGVRWWARPARLVLGQVESMLPALAAEAGQLGWQLGSMLPAISSRGIAVVQAGG